MIVNCEFCGEEIDKYAGAINRARKVGLGLYCDRMCAGLGRRKSVPIEQKKVEKSAYDKVYRKAKADVIKKRKAEYFKRDYEANPEKYREARKSQAANHAEYCRTPEYKVWKKGYDKTYLAKKHYGAFWESAIILTEIEKNVDNRLAKSINNLTNKSIKRKRKWESLKNNQNYLQVG